MDNHNLVVQLSWVQQFKKWQVMNTSSQKWYQNRESQWPNACLQQLHLSSLMFIIIIHKHRSPWKHIEDLKALKFLWMYLREKKFAIEDQTNQICLDNPSYADSSMRLRVSLDYLLCSPHRTGQGQAKTRKWLKIEEI